MKRKLLGVVAGASFFVGISALATPMPAIDARFPHCLKGKYCGSPEPGFSCPPCYYWETCGPQCGCKAIPSCQVDHNTATLDSNPRNPAVFH